MNKQIQATDNNTTVSFNNPFGARQFQYSLEGLAIYNLHRLDSLDIQGQDKKQLIINGQSLGVLRDNQKSNTLDLYGKDISQGNLKFGDGFECSTIVRIRDGKNSIREEFIINPGQKSKMSKEKKWLDNIKIPPVLPSFKIKDGGFIIGVTVTGKF